MLGVRGYVPTVNRRRSIGPLLPASLQTRWTSASFRQSPLTRCALPDLTYSWIAVSLSKTDGDRRRKVTVDPLAMARPVRHALRVVSSAKHSPRKRSAEKYPIFLEPPITMMFDDMAKLMVLRWEER